MLGLGTSPHLWLLLSFITHIICNIHIYFKNNGKAVNFVIFK